MTRIIKNRRYLLSQLFYYHRLRKLNYCIRDGNRCDLSDIFTGNATVRFSPHGYRIYHVSKSDIIFRNV